MRAPPGPQTQGERAISGTQAGCVPPQEETSRGAGQGQEENETGPRKRGRAAARSVRGRVRPEQAGDARTGSAQPGRGFHPHCRSDGRRSAAGPAGSARRCIAALQEPPPSPLPSPPSAAARLRGPSPGHAPAPPRSAPTRTGHPSPPRPSPGWCHIRTPPPVRECSRGRGMCTHRRGSVVGVNPALTNPSRVEGPAGPVGAFAVLPARPRAATAVPRIVPQTSPRSPVTLPVGLAMPTAPTGRLASRGPATVLTGSRESAWVGPAGSRDRHRERARLQGAVPGGTAAGQTLPDGTVPPAVRALALPAGWAEGGHQPRVPGPSGSEAGHRAPASSSWGQRPGTRCQPPRDRVLQGLGLSRPSGAACAGREGERGGAGGRCRRWPRVPGPAPLPGAERWGWQGTGTRVAGASAPAQRGPVPKAPALSLLWENASTVTKWRGKGGIVTASPAA